MNGFISGSTVLTKEKNTGEFFGRTDNRLTDTAINAKKSSLPDDVLVCRGGTCTAIRFATGSGVKVDAEGNLSGVSVNSAPGKSLQALTETIPNRQVGVTTLGEIRKSGGNVIPSPTQHNPDHCIMGGITPEKAEALFTPALPNPNRQ